MQIQIIETWHTKKKTLGNIPFHLNFIFLPTLKFLFWSNVESVSFFFWNTVSICRHIICERTGRNTKDRIFRYSHIGRKIGKSRVIIVCLMGSQWLFLMRHEGNCGYKLHTFSRKSFKVTTNWIYLSPSYTFFDDWECVIYLHIRCMYGKSKRVDELSQYQ